MYVCVCHLSSLHVTNKPEILFVIFISSFIKKMYKEKWRKIQIQIKYGCSTDNVVLCVSVTMVVQSMEKGTRVLIRTTTLKLRTVCDVMRQTTKPIIRNSNKCICLPLLF